MIADVLDLFEFDRFPLGLDSGALLVGAVVAPRLVLLLIDRAPLRRIA
jgi:hypothetical protein